ncbi:hypothetical protein [Flavobacterium sp. FlaQc-28]|uniref:hypothetical protein n=1 Tax=Flavobacterium sp. FlaQc-28 TaxID=3374178 RepID=UPI0037582154
MKRFRKSTVPDKTKSKIVKEWRISKLNSIPAIAKRFSLSQNVVNKIINDYLSEKSKVS